MTTGTTASTERVSMFNTFAICPCCDETVEARVEGAETRLARCAANTAPAYVAGAGYPTSYLTFVEVTA